MNAIYIALIVAVPTVIASTLAPWLLSRQANTQREEKEGRDYARQDEVALRAAEAAEKTAEIAERLIVAGAENAKETNAKLEVIRVDVNSNMTAVMRGELEAIEGQVDLMREVRKLQLAAGAKIDPEAEALLEAKLLKIAELKATLKDRLTHTEAVAAEVAAGLADVPPDGLRSTTVVTTTVTQPPVHPPSGDDP